MSILWDVGNYTKIKEIGLPVITTGTQNMGNGVYKLKAGTPLDEDGAVSNDGDAVCLVAEDFFFYSNSPTQPKLVKVIEKGYVDLAKAEAAAGITYDDACVAALATAGIVLVDGKLDGSSVGVKDELPPVPSEDGLYILQCEVTSGEAVLTWESNE